MRAISTRGMGRLLLGVLLVGGCATTIEDGDTGGSGDVRDADAIETTIPCGPGGTCTGGRMCCEGLCVDVRTDMQNCGTCGYSCAPGGNRCELGICACDSVTACGAGQTCCTGIGCADLQSDVRSCGACGTACPDGQQCSGGLCVPCPCPAGQGCCGGTCVDHATDRNHCGFCGNACGPSQICASGTCVTLECSPPCAAHESCCGTTCRNTATHRDHCGGCDQACDPGETCVASRCLCGSRECTAAERCCGGTCRNIRNDPANCGDCGVVCGTGETCSEGRCLCGGRECDWAVEYCAGTLCCPFDTVSCGSVCCALGQACCSGRCQNIATDPNNCGGCGVRCDTDIADGCRDGACVCGTRAACRKFGTLFPCQPAGSIGPQRCCSGSCAPVSDSNCLGCTSGCDSGLVCAGFNLLGTCLFSCG